MSSGIDIEIVRQSYQTMSDEELIRIATNDAVGLTSEAQEVVLEEIKRRNLNNEIGSAVIAQNKTYSIEEIDEYCELLRDLNCPICGSSESKLNGTMTSEVMSFILFTQYSKKLKVACPHCLDKLNQSAVTKTALLGWWGIPWGIIRTIKAIRENIKSEKTHHDILPNDYLRNFTLSNLGQLERFKSDKESLQRVIQ